MEDSATPLPIELRLALRELGCVRTYQPGSTLFAAGASSEGVYLVEQGAVKIELSSSKHKQVLSMAGPGALLGLGVAVTGDSHKFKAVANGQCVIWFVPRQEFLQFLRGNQECCMQIVRLLSEDLHTLYHRFQSEPGLNSRARRRKTGGSARPN